MNEDEKETRAGMGQKVREKGPPEIRIETLGGKKSARADAKEKRERKRRKKYKLPGKEGWSVMENLRNTGSGGKRLSGGALG